MIVPDRYKLALVTPPESGRNGVIVLTSSQGGLLGVYGFTAYAAAKAALIKFAEALHMEVSTRPPMKEQHREILSTNCHRLIIRLMKSFNL